MSIWYYSRAKMAQKKKGVIIFLFLITVAVFISACPEFSFASDSETTDLEQFQETKEFFLTETEEGKIKWDIRAVSAEFSSEGLVLLNNVKINLYEDENKVLNIKADFGRFDNIEKTVHLEGNVIGITDQGDSFVTQTLDWISSERKVVTDDKVKITGQNLVINAQGLVFYPDLKKIVFRKNIKAEVYGGNKAFPLKLER